jgi:hypothetical protein
VNIERVIRWADRVIYALGVTLVAEIAFALASRA